VHPICQAQNVRPVGGGTARRALLARRARRRAPRAASTANFRQPR